MNVYCDPNSSCCPGAVRLPAEAQAPADEANVEVSATPPTAEDRVEAAPAEVNFEPSTIVAHRRTWQSAPDLSAVASGDRKLGRGHEGPAVREVQRHLRALGAPIEEDGKLGPNTQAAIYAFQQAHGLTGERGRVGAGTLAELEAESAAVAKRGMDAVSHPQVVLREGIGEATAPITRLPEATQAMIRELATTKITSDDGQRKLYSLVSSAEFSGAPASVQAQTLGRIGRADDPAAKLDEALTLANAGVFQSFDQILSAVEREARPSREQA